MIEIINRLNSSSRCTRCEMYENTSTYTVWIIITQRHAHISIYSLKVFPFHIWISRNAYIFWYEPGHALSGLWSANKSYWSPEMSLCPDWLDVIGFFPPFLFCLESESPERPGCRYFIEAATLCLYLSKYYKHCSVLKIADCTFNYFVSPETRLRKHQNFLS